MKVAYVPIPAGGKWEDPPFVVVVREAKAAGRMARTTTLTRRTPAPRLQHRTHPALLPAQA